MEPHAVQAELQAAAVEFAFGEHLFDKRAGNEACLKMLLEVYKARADDEGELPLVGEVGQAFVIDIEDVELGLQDGEGISAVAGGCQRIGTCHERAEHGCAA